MSTFEYRNLLYEISRKIDANELQRMVYICTDALGEDIAGNIPDVLALFKELEKKKHLGIDRLESLKEILKTMKKTSLLKKVEKFENRRKAQSVGIISSLKRAAGTLIGAVRLVCNFRTLAGGVVLVGSGLALRSCNSFEEYSDAFNKVVLPAFTKLVELSEGSSLCFTVQAETPSALNELWSVYKNGALKHLLQEFLVSKEIKQLASGEDVEVTVCVDEQEYREAYLDLMVQQNQASEKKGQTGQRRRKNSDSFLFLRPTEDEVSSMKLEQAENKWNFKMQVLEREIEKLKIEVAKAEDLRRRMEEKGGNDDTPKLCLKDLSANVIRELEMRLKCDEDANWLVHQSFRIAASSRLPPTFARVFSHFQDTPVKLLKNVFEALQVYDLSELLEKSTKPRTAKSLRPARKKFRTTADRPTTLHSCGAVLIFADDEDDSNVIGIKTFFTDLDTKSDVTIIQFGDWFTSEFKLKEYENKTDVLTVIERWIQHQDDFTFFAIFDFSPLWIHSLVRDCLTKLVSRIPDKPKLCVFKGYTVVNVPETLQAACSVYGRYLLKLLLEILNKRWQTLDLISMMSEFNRTVSVKKRWRIIIKDSLSSLPRLKRKEELSVLQ